MKKEDFVKLGIAEDIAVECERLSQDELKGFIPKVRFDDVNERMKKAEEALLERDTQLETFRKSNDDIDTLKNEILKVQKENKAKDERHQAELMALKINNAVDIALSGAKAKNVKAVKALLKDIDKAELDDNGSVKGLQKQIDALKESDAYLFEAESQVPDIKGAKVGESGNDIPQKVDTSAMGYTELAAYLAANPGAEIN